MPSQVTTEANETHIAKSAREFAIESFNTGGTKLQLRRTGGNVQFWITSNGAESDRVVELSFVQYVKIHRELGRLVTDEIAERKIIAGLS